MSDRVARSFPLFPLDIVALPSEDVPLHIFEDCYRKMIEECLQAKREFGIVWHSEEELKLVGCACEVDRVLEQMEDGRLKVLARGTRPFRLVEREEGLPYPAAVVEFLDEHDEAINRDLAKTAHELYAELVEQATDTTLDSDELESMDAYSMAARVELGADAKQELLELRSENARLRLLTLLLRAALKRLKLVEHTRTRAISNGKVRFP